MFAPNSTSTVSGPDYVIGWEYSNSKATRISYHKATWTGAPIGPGEWLVFDLSVEPDESNDLPAQRSKLKQRLIEAWDEYARSVGVIPPKGGPLIND